MGSRWSSFCCNGSDICCSCGLGLCDRILPVSILALSVDSPLRCPYWLASHRNPDRFCFKVVYFSYFWYLLRIIFVLVGFVTSIYVSILHTVWNKKWSGYTHSMSTATPSYVHLCSLISSRYVVFAEFCLTLLYFSTLLFLFSWAKLFYLVSLPTHSMLPPLCRMPTSRISGTEVMTFLLLRF